MRRIAVIVNSQSGSGGEEERSELQRLAASLRDEVQVKLLIAETGDQLVELAREAASDRFDVLTAAGGDGTVSAVACKLLETNGVGSSDKALAVLPLGTLNHFARDLHLPAAKQGAAEVLASGEKVQVDVGEVNGRFFVNNASLGMYAKMVQIRENAESQGLPRWRAFLGAVLKVLRRGRYHSVTLTVDGRRFQRKTPLVFIGNNRYTVSGLQIGVRDRLDEGVLALILPHTIGRLGLLWLAVKALFGKAAQAPELDTWVAKEITIETGEAVVKVSLDGEVMELETPLRFRIHPHALSVLVPASPKADVAKT